MIADALRADIEKYAATRFRQNPFFRMTEEGALGRSCVRAYLQNIRYLVANTPVCLQRARQRANERGAIELEQHFIAKDAEENGHDKWAERDLQSIDDSGMLPVEVDTTGVSREMLELVDFIVKMIDRDPTLYLAYILFAEHLTVVMGPEWLALLDVRCGIPMSSMTVIANHVELDREHVEHALNEIDDLVGDPKMLYPMREALHGAMDHYELFLRAIVATNPADRSNGSRVSAA